MGQKLWCLMMWEPLAFEVLLNSHHLCPLAMLAMVDGSCRTLLVLLPTNSIKGHTASELVALSLMTDEERFFKSLA